MSLVLLIAAQAAQSAQTPRPDGADFPPTIEIRAEVRADRLEVDSAGPIRVTLTGEPEGAQDTTTARNQPAGRKTYRNLTIRYHATLEIADPLAAALGQSENQPNEQNGD
jgi:hypothetical protein